MFYRMFDKVQILPNTLKHVETCLNSTKQGGQTKKCFANQQCFSMFYRKTFTVWTGLYIRIHSLSTRCQASRTMKNIPTDLERRGPMALKVDPKVK